MICSKLEISIASFQNGHADKNVFNVYINKDNEIIKVKNFYFNRDTQINQIKSFLESIMCHEVGKVLEDGTIEKEHYRQGYIYKNYENFYKREGICYVSEYDGTNINEAGISFEGICEEVIDYLRENGVDLNKVADKKIEDMAEDLFEEVDWQYVSSLISDGWLEEYLEDFSDDMFINGRNEELVNE